MSQPKSICELFQRTAAEHADRVALRTPGGGVTITWAEYSRRVGELPPGWQRWGCAGATRSGSC